MQVCSNIYVKLVYIKCVYLRYTATMLWTATVQADFAPSMRGCHLCVDCKKSDGLCGQGISDKEDVLCLQRSAYVPRATAEAKCRQPSDEAQGPLHHSVKLQKVLRKTMARSTSCRRLPLLHPSSAAISSATCRHSMFAS